MKGELLYVYNPIRTRIMWIIIYVIVFAVGLLGLYLLGNTIGTHAIPVGEVKLVIPYSKYQVGEPIGFKIQNNFNSTIYVINNCPSEPLEVYKLVGSDWIRQHDTAKVTDCPGQGRIISVPANGSMSGTFAAWHNLFSTPGKYRVVAYVEYYNALPYQEFEVVAKPTSAAPTTNPGTTPIDDNGLQPEPELEIEPPNER